MPYDIEWTKIAFLESSANLKTLIERMTGRKPSSGICQDVGVCIQQGRLFFESAEQSRIEIRPLLLFYGTMAFAKAGAMGKRLRRMSDLSQSHGVRDVSAIGSKVHETTVRIDDRRGTFHDFNDEAATFNEYRYYGPNMVRRVVFLPSAADSIKLLGVAPTLKVILSRIPQLRDLYEGTFQEFSKSASVTVEEHHEGQFQIGVHVSARITSRDELRGVIRQVRERFPALRQWRVIRASQTRTGSFVQFANVTVIEKELDESALRETDGSFSLIGQPFANSADILKTPAAQLLSPCSMRGSLISPTGSHYLSEVALHYLGMFLLSSLVRYRPTTWVHAIRRSVTSVNPADDRALALTEEFMVWHSRVMSEFVSETFNPRER